MGMSSAGNLAVTNLCLSNQNLKISYYPSKPMDSQLIFQIFHNSDRNMGHKAVSSNFAYGNGLTNYQYHIKSKSIIKSQNIVPVFNVSNCYKLPCAFSDLLVPLSY